MTAKIALLVLLCIGAAELTLQVGSLFMHGREAGPDAAAEVRILCVGDSHTYGAPLPEPESYPSHLQDFLDERAPGRYAVINAGVPGTNTAQWRDRLPALLHQYDPHYVVFWMGVNNTWNAAALEIEPIDSWGEWLHAAASRSRLYRLLRTWEHDRAIDTERLARRGRVDAEVRHPNAGARWTIRHDDGTVEIIDNEIKQVEASAATRRALVDFAAMTSLVRARGVGPMLISYPKHNEFFDPANAAIRATSADAGVPMVDATAAAERVPEEDRVYLWADHPSGPIYREIARDVAALIP